MFVAGSKSSEKEFFSLEEFEAWRNKQDKKVQYRFLKGLGSNSSAQFKRYFDNQEKYMVQFKLDDDGRNLMDLCFLKETGFSDKRKAWLDLETHDA
jgi:hypothetical protein